MWVVITVRPCDELPEVSFFESILNCLKTQADNAFPLPVQVTGETLVTSHAPGANRKHTRISRGLVNWLDRPQGTGPNGLSAVAGGIELIKGSVPHG